MICLGAPEKLDAEQQLWYKQFFHSLGNVIPCKRCSEHYRENLEKSPLSASSLNSAESLFQWSVKLHNNVNQMLGKPVVEPMEARSFWLGIANKEDGFHSLLYTYKNKNDGARNGIHLSFFQVLMISMLLILLIYVSKRRWV